MCTCNQAIYWYAPDIILCSLFNKYDENGDGQLNEGGCVVECFTVLVNCTAPPSFTIFSLWYASLSPLSTLSDVCDGVHMVWCVYHIPHSMRWPIRGCALLTRVNLSKRFKVLYILVPSFIFIFSRDLIFHGLNMTLVQRD